MTQNEAFKSWWYTEGSQAPYTHHDCEEHTMRMCEIAWNKAQSLAQTEQEPFCLHWEDRWGCNHYADPKEPHPVNAKPLYTTPPQRKPLTNGEIYTAYITATNQMLRAQDERLAFAFARAIEAAHGIKENT